MLRYKTETRPGLVALYNIRPGNRAGQFLQPQILARATDEGYLYKVVLKWYNSISYSPASHLSLPVQALRTE